MIKCSLDTCSAIDFLMLQEIKAVGFMLDPTLITYGTMLSNFTLLMPEAGEALYYLLTLNGVTI